MNTTRLPPASHQGHDLLIALGAGGCVAALLVFAFLSLSWQSAAGMGAEGIITAKHFLAQPETQITVGQGRVRSRQSAGEYSFEVRVPAEGGKIYRVKVDPAVYRSHEVGSRYYFVRGLEGRK